MKTNAPEIRDDKVAAIGIGAMIVFIALILVAAVAAAVIIQTAEKLQQNAQSTGDDTADEMAGKIMINNVFINQGQNGYDVFFRLAPGSEPSPRAAISFQLFCDAGYQDGTNPVVNEHSTGNAIAADMQPNTGYQMVIPGGTCTPVAGEAMTMYIHVASGGSTYETLTIDSDAAGTMVV